jgi:hypothetical protein
VNIVYSLLRIGILVAIVMYALHRNTEASEMAGCVKTIQWLYVQENHLPGSVPEEYILSKVCPTVLNK